MTTLQLIQYYSSLLILQFLGSIKNKGFIETIVSGVIMDQLPTQVMNAYNLNPTVQTITFSDVPASGVFQLRYGITNTVPINWNDSLATIQLDLNLLFGVSATTVTGSLASKQLVITFNTIPVPTLLTVVSNTLQNISSVPITTVVTNNVAQGVQLDVLGKYAGVTRSGFGLNGPITLNDADFLQLIYIAIVQNSSGSSLADIQNLLNTYFPYQIKVFDYANTSPMRMTYLISSMSVSGNIIQLFLAEGLLPKPMGVSLNVIIVPEVTSLFGCCDYATATPTNPNTAGTTPLQCATTYTSGDYNLDWNFLQYGDDFFI